MYSRERSVGWGASRSLSIPPDFPIGAIFGKGGERIKGVSSRTGARVNVQQDAGCIVFTGTSSAVAAAVNDYEQQFESHRTSAITSYPHPTEAAVILCDKLKGGARFCAAAAGDEVAAATEHREQLYCLHPTSCTATQGSDGTGHEASLSALFTTAARLVPGAASDIDGPAALARAVSRLAAASMGAEAFTPAFDQVKLRFNLGRQFYSPKNAYSTLASRGAMSLPAMQGLKIGHHGDVKTVFSNALPTASVPKLRSHLVQQLGFVKVNDKSTATLHLTKTRGCSSADVSYTISGGGTILRVRKVKSGQQKLFFLARAHGDGRPDARLKLVAQRSFHQGDGGRSDDVWEAANAVVLCSGHISLPARFAASFKVDKVRFKTKEVYEGAYEAGPGLGAFTMRLSINRLRDEAGRQHWEAVGSCMELMALQAEGVAGSSCSAAEREECLHAVLAFCQALRAVL